MDKHKEKVSKSDSESESNSKMFPLLVISYQN